MLFQYKALKDNKLVVKKIEANTLQDVSEYLKNNGYLIINIKKAHRDEQNILSSLFNRVSFVTIVNFTRQMAIIMNAGLTLSGALDILKKQTNNNTYFLKILDNIDKDIKSGINFSKALKKYPSNFSNLYVSLVRSGEASGKLSDILSKIADNLEAKHEFQGKLKNALIYPAVIILVMVGIMFIMITFVLPKLLSLYKDFNVELPIQTKIMIAISDLSVKIWPIFIAIIVIGIIAAKKFLATQKGKRIWDSFTLKIPVIKSVVEMSALVDATRTLSILITAGVPILEGLQIVTESTDNEIFKQALKNVYLQVEKGTSLGMAMENEEVFPAILVQMVHVGEQTGHLDETMIKISNYFAMESSLATKAMTTLIEPAVLIVLGIGVGILVTAMIGPIYNLTGSFK